MNKPNFKKLFTDFKMLTSKHSPEILTGFGIAGIVTTAVLAVKATPKALDLIAEAEDKKDDRLTSVEVVKVAWKPYIPAAISGTVSIACMIGATSVNVRRNAALAAAYKLSETAFAEYKDKVIETIGEKKEQVVREKVAEKKVKDNPPVQGSIIVTNKGDTLCLESASGRYFYFDIEKIRRIENEVNRRMLQDITGYVSLNEFYDELGISHTSIGYEMGWNTSNLLEINLIPQLTDDERPCVVLDYVNPPKYGYYD